MREKNNGQSLVEVLIAVAIGAILITGGVMLIVPALQSNSQATKVQAASLLGKQLLDNVRVWSEGNWNNVLALSTGTSYAYYMNTSSSPFTVATGTESIVVVTSTVSTSSLTSGLVIYLPFNEGTGTITYDQSGNGNNGTLSGTTLPTWVPGKIGAGALSFNGSTSAVTLSNSASFNTMTSSFSITHWIKTVSSTSQMYTVGNAGGGNGYRFGLTSGEVAFLVGNGSDTETTCGSKTVNDGTWHMISGIFNLSGTDQFSCYIDGAFQANVSLPSNYSSMSTSAPGIGKPPCCQPFNGSLDDVRIYNRALSAAEISQLYTFGQSNVTYTRYFYISDVYRDGSGNIVTSGGTYDPSTKQITVVYSWPNGPVNTMTTYIVRGRNNVVSQNSWSGGPGVTTPETSTNNQFASSTNIDYTTSTGSIYVAIPGY